MSTVYEDLDGHEGYARRQRPEDASTAIGQETSRLDAYVATCSCGWHGTSRHDPTEEGYEAAVDEWRLRARPTASRLFRAIRRWRSDIGRRIGEVAPAAVMRARIDGLTLPHRGGLSR